MKDLHNILFRPHITEKSTIQKEENNELAFSVNPYKANKIEIRRAVEKAFNVKVLDVRTMNMEGKEEAHGEIHGQESRLEEGARYLGSRRTR